MKTKIVGDSEVYFKQKDIAILISDTFGGSMSIKVDSHIDDRKKMNKEFFVNYILVEFANNIKVYISNDDDDSVSAELDLRNVENLTLAADKASEIRRLLKNNGCKVH
jgi:hypothetical protein